MEGDRSQPLTKAQVSDPFPEDALVAGPTHQIYDI
jgi:hypothetical protein